MNHLLRGHAPISEAGWKLLDDEARDRVAPALASRKFVDFSGPHGWQYSATTLGRITPLPGAPCDGVSGVQRRVLPLVEARADFEVSRAELRDADRGADDADLAALDTAAHQIAVAENVAVFHGWGDAIAGIVETNGLDRHMSRITRRSLLAESIAVNSFPMSIASKSTSLSDLSLASTGIM